MGIARLCQTEGYVEWQATDETNLIVQGCLARDAFLLAPFELL